MTKTYYHLGANVMAANITLRGSQSYPGCLWWGPIGRGKITGRESSIIRRGWWVGGDVVQRHVLDNLSRHLTIIIVQLFSTTFVED